MINTTPLRKRILDLAVTGKVYSDVSKWDSVKLGEIAFVTKLAGFEYSKNINPALTDSGVPLFKGKNIRDGEIIWNFEDYIPEEVSLALPRSRIDKKCLLLPYVGTIGNVAVFDGATPAHLGSNVAKIEFNEDSPLLEEYVVQYIRSSVGYKALTRDKKATAQESISMAALREVKIPVPSLSEQKTILSRLEKLLALAKSIAEDAAAIDDLIAAAKRKILDLAVSGKLVKKRGGWLNARLGDLCEYGKCIGVDPDSLDANTWVLDLEDIEKDTGRLLVRVSAKDRKSTSTKHGFKKGTLLYSKLRTYLNKVLIAPEDGCCTSEILPLVFDDRVNPAYARIVLMSPMFLDYTATCCYGVKMPRLGTNDGKRGPFPLPTLEEQHAIVAKVDELFAVLDAMKGGE